MEMDDIKLLKTIVEAVVSEPGDVKVERKVDEMGVLLELTINPKDMGTIIGKEGKTAKALRTILRAFGAKNQARLNLKIIEPEGGQAVPSEANESQSEEMPAEAPSEDVAEAPVETKVAEDNEDGVTPLEESSTDVI